VNKGNSAGNPVRVVLDAMGGDIAPTNEVAGAILAMGLLGSSVQLIVVGQENLLLPILRQENIADKVELLHAPDVIAMGDEPASIVKTRTESSLYKGLALLRDGKADAFVSAGNTGAVMATATLMLGRIPGVGRPTIGSFFPTQTGRQTLVVDVGANVDSKPKFLYDYAVMGEIYSRLILGIPEPSVGLLNVGEESSKGTEVAREAFQLLTHAPLNFVGNVEGRDILSGGVDVVVCDGFEGNIVLKFAESVLGFLKSRFTTFANRSLLNKLIVGAFKPVLKTVLKDMDYQEYGGVPLLGVNGVIIIGHGSSSPLAISNMIVRAVEVVRADVNGNIQQALGKPAANTIE